MFDVNCNVANITSAKPRSIRWKIKTPLNKKTIVDSVLIAAISNVNPLLPRSDQRKPSMKPTAGLRLNNQCHCAGTILIA